MIRGKVVVITGASDGIGAEAAKALSAMEAKVVVVGRSPEKTEAVAAGLNCQYMAADFSKLDEVRNLAFWLRENFSRIDVLANNAGGMFGKRELTADGHEKTMQVNHLAHFLLTNLLIDVLLASRAKVINTSSVAHKVFSDFDVEDLDVEKKYTAHKAYGNAKLENILFTRELHRRYGDKGLAAASFHPGNVATNFAHDSTSPLKFVYHTPLKHIAGLITPKQGAYTLVWLSSAEPGRDWEPGDYYVRRRPAKTSKEAHDAQLAAKLWEKSEQMIL